VGISIDGFGEDNKLLNMIQKNFPIENRPFLKIANSLNISETEVIERIKSLKNRGFIRRLGGIFDSKNLGYCSTLCAMKVTEDKVDEISKFINSYNEVTHNYLRDHEFNLWITLIANSKERIEEILRDIESVFENSKVINLPAINVFKINLNLNVSGE
jgi:DNA-binding Lrp family transcriptional regulator